jgi:aspartate aminotransferase-like enzyme
MVFYQKAIQSDIDTIPRYMDLEYYSRTRGIPFSGSSNLLKALLTSLENRETLAFQERLADDSAWLCRQISDLGIPLLLASEERSPAILTLPLPADHSSQEIGNTLESLGFLVSFNSEYLLAKNWLQICLMAEHSRADLGLLAAALVKTMQQKAIEV